MVLSEWAGSIGSKGWDIVNGMACDSACNIFITGSISDTTINSILENSETNLNHVGFLAKYDVNGRMLWRKNLGSTVNGYGNLISISSNGQIILAGSSALIQRIKEQETKLLQFDISGIDSDGKTRWSTRITGSAIDFLTSLNIDPISGDILLSGYFNDTVTLTGKKFKCAGKSDGLMMRFDSSGLIKAVSSISGKGEDRINSVIFDKSGNSMLAGTYQRKAQIGKKKLPEISNSDETGIYIATVNPNGECIKASSICSGKNISISSIARNEDQIFIAGYFSDNLYIGPQILKSNGSDDAFLVSLTNNFIPKWIRTFGGDKKDRVIGLLCDDKKVIVTGSFCSMLSIGRDSIESTNESSDVFIIAFDTIGKLNWVRQFGGNSDDYPKCLARDYQNRLLIAGSFRDTVKNLNHSIISNGAEDIFIARLEDCDVLEPKFKCPEYLCHGTSKILDAGNGFEEYNWNNGVSRNQTFKIDREGNYSIALIALNGCRISDTVKIVEVPEPDIFIGNDTVIQRMVKLKLSAGSGFSSYTWSNGAKDSLIIIDGSNLPVKKNRVWVQVVDSNGCRAYDGMFVTVDKSGKDSNPALLNSGCQVYPNPTDGKILVTFNTDFSKLDFEIYNLFGQEIMKLNIEEYLSMTSLSFDLNGYSPGLYTIKIKAGNSVIIRKIILQ